MISLKKSSQISHELQKYSQRDQNIAQGGQNHLTQESWTNLKRRIKGEIDLYQHYFINKIIYFLYFSCDCNLFFITLKFVTNKLACPIGSKLPFVSSLTNQICKSEAIKPQR